MEPNKLEKVTNELNNSVQTYPNVINSVTGNVVKDYVLRKALQPFGLSLR